VDQGDRHPHRGRTVAITRFDRNTEADRHERSASSLSARPSSLRSGRATAFGLAALLGGLLVAGCGGGERATGTPAAPSRSVAPSSAASTASAPPAAPTATTVRVQLRGTIRAEFAGFIAAIDEGYYEAADLEVTLEEAPPGNDAVAAGSATDGPEFTVAWVPAVLERRAKGESDLVDIGQVFQRSGTLSLSWRDADITGPAGFRDQRVGVFAFGDGLEVLAGAIRAGLRPGTDFEVVSQPADLDGPIARDLDVAQATIYDGYARVLESRAPGGRALYQSSDMNVINWYDEGTAMLQDAIFARASWLADDGNEAIARRFLKATFQGWIHCRDHAAACVDATIGASTKAVVSSGSTGEASPPAPSGGASPAPSGGASPAPSADASPAPRPTFGAGHHSWSMNEVNALIWPSPAGIGVVDPTVWEHTVDVCLEAGFIPAPPAEEALKTDLAQAALAELVDIDTSGLAFAKSTVEITPEGE
jgi:NitT/TauT family transport system substrate-binding protein